MKDNNRLSNEEKLKLAIFDKLPFTVWASTREFKIILWNSECEEKYGHVESEALGKNYLNLFVDELEKEDSKKDCIDIIDNDRVFKNFLAYDYASDGTTRTMLTNCFRVFDESLDEYIQVEVGILADELNIELEKEKLHSLRELAKKRKADELEKIELLKTSFISTSTAKFEVSMIRLEMKRQQIQEKIRVVSRKERGFERYENELNQIEKSMINIQTRKQTAISLFQKASTIEQIQLIEERLKNNEI